jgi:cell division protein FtsB
MKSTALRKYWAGTPMTTKILAGMLLAVAIVAMEHRFLLKKKISTYRNLRKKLASNTSNPMDRGKKLETLEKVNAQLRAELAELRRKAPKELNGRAAVLAVIDNLAERCGLVILERKEKPSPNAANPYGKTRRGQKKKKRPTIRHITYSYSLEGRFAAIYRFFLNAERAKAPFSVSEIRLTRRKHKKNAPRTGRLNVAFEVEIPLSENES